MIRPGPRNLITDVDGVAVGNAEDRAARSGVTVVLPDAPAMGAVDVRGGAPGLRETELLDPMNLVEEVHAVVLSGGSAFGLDAAGGVMGWLAEHGRGFRYGEAVVPIVPTAILFDLLNGGDKAWGGAPPYQRLGREAVAASGRAFALGNAGAGLGAAAGPFKGGLGSVSAVDEHGVQVGALAAANPFGSVVMPGQATMWAWALEQDGELGGQPPPVHGLDLELDLPRGSAQPGANTTLAVVATNVALTNAQARRIAVMAQDGLARAVRPVHTPFDGDTVFVLSTARRPLGDPAFALARLGTIAADCVARAVARGVYTADALGDLPAYRDVHAAALAGGHSKGMP